MALLFGKKRAVVALLLFVTGFLLCFYRCPTHTLPQEKMKGVGKFAISNLKSQHSPFQHSLVYQGTLDFTAETGLHVSGLPCQIYSASSHRPSAHCDYEVTGTLVQKKERSFVFKPDKIGGWAPIANTFRFAEWRFSAKQAVYNYLKRHIPDSHTRIFLNALATGEIDDRILSLEFGRLGMQHILTISGFHFALITCFCGALLRLFCSYRMTAMLLLCVLSGYYFFLGNSPSVQRAWIAIFVVLIGQIFRLRTTALNALGVGLWAEILLDPLVLTHMGFQLSFLCTLAILMLYPMMTYLCDFLLPKRPFSDLCQMPRLDQHGYILSSLLRQALALNLAITLVSLPVLLYLFHRFPLLSLVYNFFFPFWVSLSLLLLCASLLCAPLCPAMSHLLHQINTAWTQAALEISSNPPALFDFVLRTRAVPYAGVILFLAGVFLYTMYWNEKNQDRLFSLKT